MLIPPERMKPTERGDTSEGIRSQRKVKEKDQWRREIGGKDEDKDNHHGNINGIHLQLQFNEEIRKDR